MLGPIYGKGVCQVSCTAKGLDPSAAKGMAPSTAKGLAPCTAKGLGLYTAKGLDPSTAKGLALSTAKGLAPSTAKGSKGDVWCLLLRVSCKGACVEISVVAKYGLGVRAPIYPAAAAECPYQTVLRAVVHVQLRHPSG